MNQNPFQVPSAELIKPDEKATENPRNSFPAFVLRAWSGELPLWQAFWLGLALGTVALSGVLRFFVVDFLFPFSVRDALLFFFLLSFPVLIFLWVVVWRSASKSSRVLGFIARAIVISHAIWFGLKLVRYLGIYVSLT